MNTLTAYQTAMVLDWLLDIGASTEGQSITDSELALATLLMLIAAVI
jgi:hypothetical protein